MLLDTHNIGKFLFKYTFFNKSFLPHIGWLLWYSPHPAGLSAPYKVYKKRFRQQKSAAKQKKREKTKTKKQYKYFLFPLLYLQV